MTIDRVQSLNNIIQYEVPILPFRHFHLKRKPKIGVIGQPGEGKSITIAFLALNQFMIFGEPCWSNLPIKYTYKVGDAIASDYGLVAGDAMFASNPLDKFRLIKMDGGYQDGVIVLDEINIEFADALKSTTNVNFYFDQADQQLRKDRNGLVYSTIDEMWIDPRLRSITDIFVICEDTALDPEGLLNSKAEGHDIRWKIYPMTRMFNGHTWNEAHTVYTCIFHARQFWGIMDTYHKQATGRKYAVDLFKETAPYSLSSGANQVAVREYSKWGSLYDAIAKLRDEGVRILPPGQMWSYLRQYYPNTDVRQLGQQLSIMGIKRTWGYKGDYIIDLFKLEKPKLEKVLEFTQR